MFLISVNISILCLIHASFVFVFSHCKYILLLVFDVLFAPPRLTCHIEISFCNIYFEGHVNKRYLLINLKRKKNILKNVF